MPAFGLSLSSRQIDDVALFLEKMDHLSADQRFAWTGAPLRAELRSTLDTLGGFRKCVYFPSASVPAHHFVSQTSATRDGAFIVEHFYNRGISEYAVIGIDSQHRQFIRTQLSKSGTADVAVAPFGTAETMWRSISDPVGATTAISPERDGSYEFRSSDAPGFGRCEARSPVR